MLNTGTTFKSINIMNFSVDLTDPTAPVCELSHYPEAGDQGRPMGPAVLTFFEDEARAIACGGWGNASAKNCYSFDGSDWVKMIPWQENHCPYSHRSGFYYKIN